MGIYTVIDNRAWKVLRTVAGDFQSFASIDSVEENHIRLNGTKLGVAQLSASYRIINKWMGRVYVYTWTWSLPDDSVQDDLFISCKYKSSKSALKEVQFVSKQSSPLLQTLNNDKVIKQLCNSIDYEAIEIRYSREKKEWQVEMRPNYGDFIWILMPPVKYARRPKQQEIQDTMRLIKRIAQLLKHT